MNRPTTPALGAAERSVVGALVVEWPAAPTGKLARIIAEAPRCFEDSQLGAIVAAGGKLAAQGTPVEPTSLLRETNEGVLLAQLALGAPSLALAEVDAETVWGAFLARDAADFLADAQKALASDPTETLRDLPGRLAAFAESLGAIEGNSLRPAPVKLFDAVRLDADHQDMLFQNRAAKRGESWLVIAPTGVGKSVVAVECAMLWALGRPFLGFEPVRPLSSLLFVAEDDEDEMAWFRDGIAKRHAFTPDERAAINERVHFVEVCDLTGASFVARDVIPNAERLKPDLLHLNPALAYIGAEANDQRQVAAFLRGQWQPVLNRIRAGSFVYHHTPKPPANRKDDPQRYVADLSYAGLGSVEWANWPRGILSIQPTPTPGLFKLVCPKRAARLGWRDPEGNPTAVRYIAHSTEPGTLGWRDANPDETPKPAGRPRSASPEKVLGLLADHPMPTKEWTTVALDELGVSRSAFMAIRADLEAAGRIWKSALDGWHIKNQEPRSEKSNKSENPISGRGPISPPL